MEGTAPKTTPRVGQTVYLVESCRIVREAVVRSYSGGLYTVCFTDSLGGIRLRADRLYPTRDAASAHLRQRKVCQPILPPAGIWHNRPLWQC